MEAFRKATARHHAAGEFVDDDEFVVADDVILVELEQLVRLQRLVDVVHEGDVVRLVERALGEHLHLAQQLLDMLVAGLGQVGRALLLVEIVILDDETRDRLVDGIVELRLVVGRAGNDERRARLVDQDRIHLVDHREIVPALAHLVQLVLHVVAKVIEPELVVGAVGHVGGIAFGPLRIVETMHDDAGGEAEELVEAPHLLGVAAREVVVDGDDMDALALEGVEVHGERRDQRLALAGLHLGDAAFVQHHAADQLNVEMALTEHPLGRLAHRGEGRDQDIVERRARRELLTKHDGAGGEVLVAQLDHLGL